VIVHPEPRKKVGKGKASKHKENPRIRLAPGGAAGEGREARRRKRRKKIVAQNGRGEVGLRQPEGSATNVGTGSEKKKGGTTDEKNSGGAGLPKPPSPSQRGKKFEIAGGGKKDP